MNLQTYINILSSEIGRPFDFPTQQIIKELIIANREDLIRQSYVKTGILPQGVIISTCFSMEYVSSTKCCGIDLGCNLAITIVKVPRPMQLLNTSNFNYVGAVDGMNPFGYIPPDEIPFVKYRKFSKEDTFYTVIDDKIVIINLMPLSIKVRYPPANPLELAEITNCTGQPCYDIEENTFIEGHWEDALTKRIMPKLQQLIGEQIEVDETPNK